MNRERSRTAGTLGEIFIGGMVMGITEAGLEGIGFVRIPENTTITCKFHIAYVYAIRGIKLNEIYPTGESEIININDQVRCMIGNNLNEMSVTMFNDSWTENYENWNDKYNSFPPYLLVGVSSLESYKCSEGYWRTIDEHLMTYNCFMEPKRNLVKYADSIVPNIVTSVLIEFNKKFENIEIDSLEKQIFGKTNEGKNLSDIFIETSADISIISNLEKNDIEEIFSDVKDKYNEISSKVSSLICRSFGEKNQFMKFLNLYQALEIHTHSTYKKLNFEKYCDMQYSYPSHMSSIAKQHLIKSFDTCKNLTDRFISCSLIEWTQLNENDVSIFKKIKKIRDALSHGERVNDNDLPIKELDMLLHKILL
jgi:hypothetical protein